MTLSVGEVTAAGGSKRNLARIAAGLVAKSQLDPHCGRLSETTGRQGRVLTRATMSPARIDKLLSSVAPPIEGTVDINMFGAAMPRS